MSILAALAQIALMRPFALTGVKWCLHVNPAPLLEAICHSPDVGLVQNRSANSVAAAAALVIHSRIVLFVGIHADRDCNHLTRPGAGGTVAVVTYEPAHDVAVIAAHNSVILVVTVEAERKVVRVSRLATL